MENVRGIEAINDALRTLKVIPVIAIKDADSAVPLAKT